MRVFRSEIRIKTGARPPRPQQSMLRMGGRCLVNKNGRLFISPHVPLLAPTVSTLNDGGVWGGGTETIFGKWAFIYFGPVPLSMCNTTTKDGSVSIDGMMGGTALH